MDNTHIKFSEVSLAYGHSVHIQALKDLSFDVKRNEFLCLIGPSGCGKSTALHILSGFIKNYSGSVHVNQKKISGPGIDRGIVFQEPNLFFWRTVIKNIEFALEMSDISKQDRRQRAIELLELVGLKSFEDRYPFQLSGGEKQRVAIARSMIANPDIILFDEPFRSLDAQSRILMQQLLLSLWDKMKRTIIFVTHDLDEAIFLADRILVMTSRPGRIKEEIIIPFPRPRNNDLLVTTEFSDIKRKLMNSLSDSSEVVP